MNTSTSDKKAKQWQAKGTSYNRKVQTYEKTFNFSLQQVYRQFCPSRECDWIEGWDCNLIFTSSGYMEDKCIFTTDEKNVLGPGLWITVIYEPDKTLELVRLIGESLVIHFRIDLTDNNNGTTTGRWTITFTALNDQGNAMVDSIPDQNPEMARAIESLDYFLRTGEMMTMSSTLSS